MRDNRNPLRGLVLVGGDILMILIAFSLSGFTRFVNFYEAWALYQGSCVILVVVYIFNFYIFNLYEYYQRFKSSFFLSRFLMAVLFGFAISAMLFYFILPLRMGRGMAFLNAGYIALFIPLWRFLFERLFLSYVTRKRIIVIGAGRVGRFICGVIKDNPGYEIVGLIDDDPQKHHTHLEGFKVLGPSKFLLSLLNQNLFDMAVVAITHEKKVELLHSLLAVKMSQVEVIDVPSFYEEVTGRIPMEHLRVGWLVFASFKAMSRHLYLHCKRYFDIFLSLVGLVLAAPIMFLCAIAIKIDSQGPLIYTQRRIGQDGREFLMYKFRSMVVGAERKEGGLYTSTTDARVTRVGRFMRKARIDEILQLVNILIGNMSFVGPRPEAVALSEKYATHIPFYALRHIAKPGLTGWAQVKYQYSASTEDALEKFEYDMYYLKNMSFFLDIQII